MNEVVFGRGGVLPAGEKGNYDVEDLLPETIK